MVMLKNEGDSGQPIFLFTFYDMARASLSAEERTTFDAYNAAALELSRTPDISPTEVIDRVYGQVPDAKEVLAKYDRKVGRLMWLKPEGEVVE